MNRSGWSDVGTVLVTMFSVATAITFVLLAIDYPEIGVGLFSVVNLLVLAVLFVRVVTIIWAISNAKPLPKLPKPPPPPFYWDGRKWKSR